MCIAKVLLHTLLVGHLTSDFSEPTKWKHKSRPIHESLNSGLRASPRESLSAVTFILIAFTGEKSPEPCRKEPSRSAESLNTAYLTYMQVTDALHLHFLPVKSFCVLFIHVWASLPDRFGVEVVQATLRWGPHDEMCLTFLNWVNYLLLFILKFRPNKEREEMRWSALSKLFLEMSENLWILTAFLCFNVL